MLSADSPGRSTATPFNYAMNVRSRLPTVTPRAARGSLLVLFFFFPSNIPIFAARTPGRHPAPEVAAWWAVGSGSGSGSCSPRKVTEDASRGRGSGEGPGRSGPGARGGMASPTHPRTRLTRGTRAASAARRVHDTQTDPDRKRPVFSDDGCVFRVAAGALGAPLPGVPRGTHFPACLAVPRALPGGGSAPGSLCGSHVGPRRAEGGRGEVCVRVFLSLHQS